MNWITPIGLMRGWCGNACVGQTVVVELNRKRSGKTGGASLFSLVCRDLGD